jgi:antibiotic biosynthesis monooxygenase (ABM) superfamily enzyme
MSNSKNRAVMMLVSRRVKPGYEAEFERLMKQFIDAAANFPGCLGAQLVHPGDEVDVEDSLYHAVLAFENPDSLRAWQNSSERLQWLTEASAYIEGQAMVREVSGLAHWFQTSTNPTQAPPPRWKVAVVTWLGIFPTVYLLFLLLSDVLAPWPLLPRIMVITVLVVTLMTWLVAPQLTRLLKPWLYPSSTPRP